MNKIFNNRIQEVVEMKQRISLTIRMAAIKTKTNTINHEGVEKFKHLGTVGGNVNCCSRWENSVDFIKN